MHTVYSAIRNIFYVACVCPALLLLSSFGSSMDSDANQKLTRAIIALVASPTLALVGIVAGAVASWLRSPHARAVWIATAVAAAPGILTLVAVTLSTHH